MNRVLEFPSLQHLTMVKIVAGSWNQREIWTLHSAFLSVEMTTVTDEQLNLFRNERLAIEDKVRVKISAFPLPEILKKLLSNLIEPVGSEISNFYGFYLAKYPFYAYARLIDASKPICWTVWGTVDWKNSAELYVKDEELNVDARYELACHNCLEDDIRKLFKRISVNLKYCLILMESCLGGNYLSIDGQIVVLWTCKVNVANGEDFFSRAIRETQVTWCALAFSYTMHYNCTPAACEYFFEHLSQELKDTDLVNITTQMIDLSYQIYPNHYLDHVIPYFFLRLSEEQAEKLFRQCVLSHLLKRLLVWPWQSLFMETVRRALPFMTEYAFSEAMNDIVRAILAGFEDFNYARLFRELWQLRPAHCKDAFPDKTLFVKMFLESEEDELFRFVRREATEIQIQELDDELDEQSVERVVEELVERVEKVVDEAG